MDRLGAGRDVVRVDRCDPAREDLAVGPDELDAVAGASLLAVGVTQVDGRFRAGDGVELVGPDGEVFARGIASVDADDVAAGAEAVHRDRLVLL